MTTEARESNPNGWLSHSTVSRTASSTHWQHPPNAVPLRRLYGVEIAECGAFQTKSGLGSKLGGWVRREANEGLRSFAPPRPFDFALGRLARGCPHVIAADAGMRTGVSALQVGWAEQVPGFAVGVVDSFFAGTFGAE